jgi:pyruvate dehydrogenase E2 component (dihydrolipoamide acetyltransferase)
LPKSWLIKALIQAIPEIFKIGNKKMATEILLPQWAMGLAEGTIVRWLKAKGDFIEEGEPLAEVEEAKVTAEVVASTAGYLLQILVQEGETVPVHTPLCLIGSLEELQAQSQPQTTSQPSIESATPLTDVTEVSKAQHTTPVQVTSDAQKLAKEYKLDLATIQGSGPGGQITETDVQRAHAEQSMGSNETEIRLTGMRGTVAQRMYDSIHNSAQFTMTMQADVTELLRQREALKSSNAVNVGETPDDIINVTLTDVLVKATALTLQKHPRLNGWVDTEKIRLVAEIHIGLAVAIDEGLVVPVLHNADRKSLREISAENKELAKKAREKTFSAEEISGSTFTITNLGALGVDFFTPIINPPEIAILGVGAVKDYPLKQGDGLVWRKSLPLSLTIDHRAVDGAPAAVFLRDLKNCLEQIDLNTL